MTMTTADFCRLALRTHKVDAYVDLCEAFVRETPPHNAVRIDDEALARFAQTITAPTGTAFGWNNYISAEANAQPLSLTKVFHEMAAIVGQLGGFFERTAVGIRKWEVDGSGAKAMVQKMAEIRETVGVPGETQAGFKGLMGVKLARAFAETPFASWRTKALNEFMSYDSLRQTEKLLRDCAIGDLSSPTARLSFDLPLAQQLAETFPVSFGGDPLFKKASLTLLMVDTHIAARKTTEATPTITLNTIAAADYRLPQALSAQGVDIIQLSPRLRQKLLAQNLVSIMDPDVVKLRTASVVAAHRLCVQSGQPMSVVDAALWGAGRTLEKQGRTLPVMRVLTTHF